MGKARTFSNEGEEANYLKESEDEIYSSTQQNSYNLGSTTFSNQSGIGNFAQSGTDQRKANLTGALFRGNIGFLLQSALLDETTSTIILLEDQNGDPVSDVSSDRIVIISGVATTADLEIISGAQRPGQRLVLYNTDGNTITIKDASTAGSPTDPNLIRTPGALDYIISGFDSVQLVFDSIEEQWRIVGAVGTGGGTGYNLIQDEGISLTQRTTMNFIGNLVTAVDNPGQSRTDITINAPAGTVPSGSAENQHLEWDNSGLTWDAVDFLTMGSTGPFASDGLIRFANDQIMLSSRNAADDGDIEIKVTSSDKFIFDFDGAVPLEISFNEIDVKTVDIINIDRLKFVQSSGSMVPSDATGILLNSNNQFQFNTADTSDFVFTFDNNDPSFVIDRDISDNDNTLVSILSDETDINSASFLNITKSFPIPLSLQEIGHLNFIAGNSLGSTLFEYASIIGKIEDTTNGAIEGSMIFNATVNNAVTPFIQLNDSSDGIIKALKNLDMFNNNIESTATPTVSDQFRIIFDAHDDSDTFISNTPTVDLIHFESNGIGIVDIIPTGLLLGAQIDMNDENIKNVGNMDFGPFSATSGRIRLPAGGGGAIKWESVPAGFDGEMYFDNDFNWFVDTGGSYKFWAGGTQIFEINETDINLQFGNIEDVTDITMRDGFNVSKLFFDGGVDTYLTGSGSTGRINIFADGTNFVAFDPVGISLFQDSYLTINERVSDPTFATNAGKFYVKEVAGNAEPWFVGDGTVAQSLLGGGDSWTDSSTNTSSGTKTFENTRFALENQVGDFIGLFTHSSTANIVWTLPSASTTLIGTPLTQDLDAASFDIEDLKRLEFDELGSIPDNTQSLITSIFEDNGGNNGQEMIFNIPNLGFRNDFWKFFSGSYPNNPVGIIGRRLTQFQTDITGEFRVISNEINLDVSGSGAQINFGGGIGTDILPFNTGLASVLDLGATGQANDSEFWRTLYVKKVVFQGPTVDFTNIEFVGGNLQLQADSEDDIIFTDRTLGEFGRFTNDGDVFDPKLQLVVAGQLIANDIAVFNGDATFNEDVVLGSAVSDLITINGETNILEDLKFNANRTIDWNVSTFSPTATAGGGQATPATVLGFLFIKINGANAKIPFYGV